MIAFRLGDLDIADRTFDHGRRARKAVLFDEFAFQAAGVDADAHRQALVLGLANDLAKSIVAADVAGVDADFVDGMIERRQGHLVVEVNIANQRNTDLFADLRQGFVHLPASGR